MDRDARETKESGKRIWTWLFNPFHFIAGTKALTAGLIVLLLSGAGAWAIAGHFDGVLDFHVGFQGDWWLPFAEILIDWVVLSVCLWIVARVFIRQPFRAVDLFGTQALARFPTLGMLLPFFFPPVKQATVAISMGMSPNSPIAFLVLAISVFWVFGMLIWMVWLMYQAFSVSCNAKGGRGIALFAAALLTAEVLSKIAIMSIMPPT